MEQKQSRITFEVRMEENGNHTWQGRLIQEGQVIAFQSELELLMSINQLLCADNKVTGQQNGQL